MTTTIRFYEVDTDSDDFVDWPVGEVFIDDDGQITATDPELLAIAGTKGETVGEVVQVLSDWSNGYLRSEILDEVPKEPENILEKTEGIE